MFMRFLQKIILKPWMPVLRSEFYKEGAYLRDKLDEKDRHLMRFSQEIEDLKKSVRYLQADIEEQRKILNEVEARDYLQ